eukprot:CAMPEP_0184317660 /NCGR_PEP_ID=MMETSP1049-20130417/98004_1 /TAXON_ID=77928 /ORGANISM="Proteomonas sulcata, Strain CCMP704" /LENGTH=66 /DNA_ID=CAMNT_0026637139 /DNA_START=24 /DNA_END=220 /DNA_ORIENTATION=-
MSEGRFVDVLYGFVLKRYEKLGWSVEHESGLKGEEAVFKLIVRAFDELDVLQAQVHRSKIQDRARP